MSRYDIAVDSSFDVRLDRIGHCHPMVGRYRLEPVGAYRLIWKFFLFPKRLENGLCWGRELVYQKVAGHSEFGSTDGVIYNERWEDVRKF